MSRPPAPRRAEFRHFLRLPTRWMDNDVYGHINNVVYYSYFDTAVNRYLIEAGALDIAEGDVIGLVVETGCRFFHPLSFPEILELGLRVEHLGNSSVRYGLGVFREGADEAAAHGHFVHVYVERRTRRPTALPAPLRRALRPLLASASDEPAERS